MNVFEMEGFLRGKCMPGDILVNESTAEYLVRKLNEATVVKAERDSLAVENAALKSAVTAKAYIDFIESNGWNTGVKTINGKFAGFMDPEVDFGSMTFEHAKKLIDAVETPATDAGLSAIEARGLEKFADMCREKSKLATTADSCAGWSNCSVHASSFAIRLREDK
ncbi:hypothetical protein [Serratia liquefaciens]|uniref:hypothetical protein n=1 Tax=Serratia liquefaciens TaxID=614 RepID=UPI00381BB712